MRPDKAKSVGPALEGIKVLDLTRLIPGAICTSILGDYGAEVIKVEEIDVGDYERQIPPFIGPMASRFLILNRNKKSVSLNLKQEEGKELFLKMVGESDVLVEGFRPGAMKKLGLDYDSLKTINPGLIYCSISSFGHDGPYRDVVAHDINILGMAGFLDITGVKNGGPAIPGVQIADSTAGLNAALAILIASISKTKTGNGQFLDISMFDGVMSWMFDAARYVFSGEDVPKMGEGRLSGGFPNYRIYETKGGEYITVGSLESKFKRTLLKQFGREDLFGDEGKATSTELNESDKELHSYLQDVFLTKTRNEWIEELGKLNICVGPVNSVKEALSHPQTLFRKMVTSEQHPSAGRINQIGSALKFSGNSVPAVYSPAPELGEHTGEILARLGCSKNEVDDLVKKDIVRNNKQ